MSASSRRIEICPTTKPCRKVGCKDNSDVAGIVSSGVFYGLPPTVDVTGKWLGSKSEPHLKHMGTQRCPVCRRSTTIDSRVIPMPWHNNHGCNEIIVEVKKLSSQSRATYYPRSRAYRKPQKHKSRHTNLPSKHRHLYFLAVLQSWCSTEMAFPKEANGQRVRYSP